MSKRRGHLGGVVCETRRGWSDATSLQHRERRSREAVGRTVETSNVCNEPEEKLSQKNNKKQTNKKYSHQLSTSEVKSFLAILINSGHTSSIKVTNNMADFSLFLALQREGGKCDKKMEKTSTLLETAILTTMGECSPALSRGICS